MLSDLLMWKVSNVSSSNLLENSPNDLYGTFEFQVNPLERMQKPVQLTPYSFMNLC